jgi:hypothetical protein
VFTKDKYFDLCSLTDQLINGEDTAIERVAISMAHVIRPHPSFLNRYNFFLKTYKNFLSTLILLKKTFFLIKCTYQLFKSIAVRKNKYEFDKKISHLFVSHFINLTHLGDEKDFYFGDTPLNLKKNGHDVGIILINHTQLKPKFIEDGWSKSQISRIALSDKLSFREELEIIVKSLIEFLNLKRIEKKTTDVEFKKIINKASEDVLTFDTFKNIRIGIQIRNIVKAYYPDKIICTYEGYAWERIIFSQAKKVKPKIKCIGYQHAALFKDQHAIFRPLGEIFNPDLILTSGRISLEIFKEKSKYPNTDIKLFGSHKYSNIKEINKINLDNTNTCLVLPEGVESECILLFSFTLEFAKNNPQFTFIWRVHPILNISQIIKNNSIFNNLPRNIIISDNALELDFKKSYWAIYRGTTSIIEAIYQGLIPLYYDVGNFNIDPLYKINSSKLYIKNQDQIHSMFNSINSTIIENELTNLRNNINYIYSPIDLNVYEL